MHVISHEPDHVAEFKSRRSATKQQIRNLDIKIDYEFRNGKLVAVGGETSVITKQSNKHLRAVPALRDDAIDFNAVRKSENSNDGLTMQESKLKESLSKSRLKLISLLKTYYSNPNFKTPSDIKGRS